MSKQQKQQTSTDPSRLNLPQLKKNNDSRSDARLLKPKDRKQFNVQASQSRLPAYDPASDPFLSRFFKRQMFQKQMSMMKQKRSMKTTPSQINQLPTQNQQLKKNQNQRNLHLKSQQSSPKHSLRENQIQSIKNMNNQEEKHNLSKNNRFDRSKIVRSESKLRNNQQKKNSVKNLNRLQTLIQQVTHDQFASYLDFMKKKIIKSKEQLISQQVY